MQTTQNTINWSAPEVTAFLVHRTLHGDEANYQEIKRAAKHYKQSIRLATMAIKNDTEKGRAETVKTNQDLLASLRQEQRANDNKLVANRNPDSDMLSTYIDLHGCSKEQGVRILYNQLSIVQQSLIAGALKPNFRTGYHIYQVITGDGKLCLAIKDFLSMAGYDFLCKESGAFLVNIVGTTPAAEAIQQRIKANQAMYAEFEDKWAKQKQFFKTQRQENKAAEKVMKFAEKHNGLNKEQWKAQKAEAKAEKQAAKAEQKEQKLADKAMKFAEKHNGMNKVDWQAFKAESKAAKAEQKEQRKADRAAKGKDLSADQIVQCVQNQGFNKEQIAQMQQAIENVTPTGDMN